VVARFGAASGAIGAPIKVGKVKADNWSDLLLGLTATHFREFRLLDANYY